VQRDTLALRTSENVELDFDVAGIGSRVLAFILDAFVLGLILFCADLLVAGLAASASPQALGLLIAFADFVGLIAYFVIAETATGGRSPGKTALGLRVIRVDGSAAGFREALVRGVLRVVDLSLGIFPMFVSARSRRFGDLLAGTVVVRERRTHVSLPPPLPVVLRTPDAGPAIDNTATLGERELSTLRAFLARPGLTPEQRLDIAATMAARLYERLGLAADAPERLWPPELFVERLYLQLAGGAVPLA
jgi:uncharacterized RDD family membrane protein YckC